MELKFNIKLTKKQHEAYDILHNKNVQYLIARWSRQCGKTVFAEMMLIENLFYKGRFSAYISPTYSQGKKVYSEIVGMLQDCPMVRSCNASDLKIEMTNGSSLKFFSMESPTAIRGYTVNGILVLDEAAFFPSVLPNGEDPFSNIIFPITKANHPKVLVISTPNGKQGMFYDMFLRCNDRERNVNGAWKSLTATIYDDELTTPEEIEEIKKVISPLAFKQEFLVEFLDSAITVFPGFDECFDARYGTGRCWIGVDPSTVGDDRTVVTLVDNGNNVRQFVVDGSLDEKYSKIAKIINENQPVGSYIEDNSIGMVMYNEIRKRLRSKGNFCTFTTTNGSKKEYVSMIAVAVANREIHFEIDNDLLRSELGTFSYRFTKGGNVTYAAKDGYHDDTVTSLGIALMAKKDFHGSAFGRFSFVKQPNLTII